MDLNLLYWNKPGSVAHSHFWLQIKNVLPSWIVAEGNLSQLTSCKWCCVLKCSREWKKDHSFFHTCSLLISRRCFPNMSRTVLWPVISYLHSITRKAICVEVVIFIPFILTSEWSLHAILTFSVTSDILELTVAFYNLLLSTLLKDFSVFCVDTIFTLPLTELGRETYFFAVVKL